MPRTPLYGSHWMRTTLWGLGLLLAAAARPQLPPEAVDLSRVKIPETQKSEDLCPVHLKPSDRAGEAWTHDGVAYRGCEAGEKAVFFQDPERYAEMARKQRYVNNFMMAMSTIWCPITDEVTPGGRRQVKGLGYNWESCCSFCDEDMHEENFHQALDRLHKRAEESYRLTGGRYTEGASSPVEGAIREDL